MSLMCVESDGTQACKRCGRTFKKKELVFEVLTGEKGHMCINDCGPSIKEWRERKRLERQASGELGVATIMSIEKQSGKLTDIMGCKLVNDINKIGENK